MNKIKEIIVGTNNIGKYEEICCLLPKRVIKHSPKKLNIKSPKETGKTFKENSFIKASYFSKKSKLICISDDSGLEIDLLNGDPGIFSARWGGKKNDFDLAIEKVFKKMKSKKKNWEKENKARFVCCMTIFFPNGQSFLKKGIVNGHISKIIYSKPHLYIPSMAHLIYLHKPFLCTFHCGEQNISNNYPIYSHTNLAP